MIDTVLFDLYGTLVRFDHGSRNPYLELATRASTDKARDLVRQSLTNKLESLADFAAFIGLPPQADINDLDKIIQSHIDSTDLYYDALPALESLKNRRLKIGLISNLASPYKAAVVNCEIQGFFDTIVYSCDCGFKKPQPEIYQLALSELDSEPGSTIMVGDSFKSDVQGPRSVGIQSIHLVRNESASSADSDLTINSLSQLSMFL